MNVRIGIIQSPKEIEVDLGPDAEKDKVQKEIESVLEERSDKPSAPWLTDKRGRKVGVPTEKIAYVEIGSDEAERRVGFVG